MCYLLTSRKCYTDINIVTRLPLCGSSAYHIPLPRHERPEGTKQKGNAHAFGLGTWLVLSLVALPSEPSCILPAQLDYLLN